MRIIENKQGRLRHYVGASKRLLLKARELYIDTMVNFDGKVGGAATHINTPPHQLPKNLGRSKQDVDKGKDVDELYRSISKKCIWVDMESNRVEGYLTMDRSYSIAIGKMGTIDEEEPCDFNENVTAMSEILFPRSRSVAVTRNSAYQANRFH